MLFPTCLLTAFACLAGCDNAGSPGAFGTPPVGNAPDTVMEFRGQRGCTDCEGIEALLTLQQRGDERRYQLVEVYRAVDRERRFEDQGQWMADGDVVRLHSTNGSQRAYLVLPDNRLQAAGLRGQILPAIADDVLVPTNFSNTR